MYYDGFYDIITLVIKMKKTISVFLTVLILLSMFFTVPAFANDKVELDLSDATVYAGEEFEVKLFISDNSQLSGAVIDLSYDATMLKFVSAENGAILDESAMISIKEFSEESVHKYVRFTYMSPDSSITSEGILFSVKFKALETAEGRTSIKVSIPNAGDFVNSKLDKLPYEIQNSNVRIINANKEDAELTTETTIPESEINVTSTTAITTLTENVTTPNQKANSSDDGLKIVVGLFATGVVLLVGVIGYVIISKKKKR